MAKIQNEHAKTGGSAVKDLIYQRAKELKKYGHSLLIPWVPGRADIEGNERADSAAKDVDQKGGREQIAGAHSHILKQSLKNLDYSNSLHCTSFKTKEEKLSAGDFILHKRKLA